MTAQPGWYPDSAGTTRYWDGQQWTGHTMDGPTVSTPVQEPGAPDATAGTDVMPSQPQAYAQPQPYTQRPQQYAAPTAYAHPHAQPYPYAQPSAYPRPVTTGSNGIAVAGFVVGLVSVFLPLIFGLAAGITGLVLSIVGLNRAPLVQSGRGLAIAGIVLSAVGILFII